MQNFMKIGKAIATDDQSKITEVTCYAVGLAFSFGVVFLFVGFVLVCLFLINTLNSPI